ncbi:uncharacterized protein LOC131334892 [Rhododendron vialii]|uniref:uncharacterized protein LOC131334892 n=1 Tax=Rhododendron vialii TaxID=182163 RepID=UPI00265D6312|nr:uncharacterized protein LOC131334892 [Rhododendron vialii]
MCQTLGSKADGSSEGGVTCGGDSTKGKCTGLMTKVRDWKGKNLKNIPYPEDPRIEFEGFTLSKGLIFKAHFSVYNPLTCGIPKWKSAHYTLKFPDGNREIANGKVPSKWLRAKKKTTVDVTINVSLNDLGDKLKEIMLQTIIDGHLKVELALKITFGFPIIGDVPVSQVLDKCLSPALYKLVQLVLDTIEGNKKNIPKALSEILEALTHYYDDQKKALDHVADDLQKNWEQINNAVQAIQKLFNPQEIVGGWIEKGQEIVGKGQEIVDDWREKIFKGPGRIKNRSAEK